MLQKMLISLVFFVLVSPITAQVELEVWLEKDTYLLGEPVILFYKVVNHTDREFMFDYNIILKDAQGKQYKGIFAKPFVQYKPNFFPGDAKTGWVNLVSKRGYPSVIYKGEKTSGGFFFLPVGSYSVQFQFDDEFHRGEEVMFETLSFRIVEPQGKEAEVFEQFLQADKWYFNKEKRDEAYRLLLHIGMSYPESVYAPIAFLQFFVRSDKFPEWYRNQLKPAAVFFFRHYPSHPFVEAIITNIMAHYLTRDREEGIRLLKALRAKNISPEVNNELENAIKSLKEFKSPRERDEK